jgi:L-aminopeptidase/D-esterase-like protein
MRTGTANEAAYILLIAFTAIMYAALKKRIAARTEDGMVRLIAGMRLML